MKIISVRGFTIILGVFPFGDEPLAGEAVKDSDAEVHVAADGDGDAVIPVAKREHVVAQKQPRSRQGRFEKPMLGYRKMPKRAKKNVAPTSE